jgi:hypothetical protein
VGEIPHHQRPGSVGPVGHVGHVVHPPGAVVDVGEEHDGRGVVEDSIDADRRVDVDQPKREPVGQRDALGDVQVGREVESLGHDLGPAR